MDLNNELDINRLISAAKSPHGKLIIKFFSEQLNTLDYNKIDKDLPLEKTGAKYLAIRETKDFVNKIISLLTPSKGD